MTLKLTPEMIAAAYSYLCTAEPFIRWNLPEPEDVTFKVARTRTMFGSYENVGGDRHTITASSGKIGQTMTLMRLLAHELVHMHLEITGIESKRGGPETHNTAFRKFAAEICKVHGFDPKEFF